jgi:hypothetical protein
MTTIEETLDVRAGLQKMRDDQLLRLAALASDKREAQHILQQIQVLDRALGSYHSSLESLKYARFKSAITAILAYLDDTGRPVSQEQLIQALIDGGWRHGDEHAATNLKQSIASFVSGLGRKTKQIKQVNGLIGRGEWSSDLFVP